MTKNLKFDDFRTRLGSNYAFVKINDKEGIIDKNLEWVIKPEYDFIKSCYKEYFIVRNGDKYGIIDKFNNVIIPMKYDYILSNPDKYSNGVIVSKNGKFKLLYIEDNIESPFAYDFLWSDDFKHFVYILNNKYGLAEESNRELIPCKYDDMTYFKDFVIAKNRFKSVEFYDNKIETNDKDISGVLSFDNKILIPFEYDDIIAFSDEDKNTPFEECLFAIKKDKYYTIVNSDLEKINNQTFDFCAPWGPFVFMVKNRLKQKNYFLNTNGKQILETSADTYFSDIIFKPFNEKESIACYKKRDGSNDGYTDIINNNGEVLFSDKIEKLRTNCNNSIILKKEGKYGAVDRYNNIIIPFKEGELFGLDKFYIRKHKDKWMFE